MASLYLGLISGTSLDGIDVALVDFKDGQPDLVDFDTFDYPPSLTQTLHTLCQPSQNELVTCGRADRQVGHAFAEAVLKMLHRHDLQAHDIQAIGSHGQTVRHHPQGESGFSLQIGDPNTLACETQIDVIADFRRRDIALGGEGAPLAPALHDAAFRSTDKARVIVNIGGISNLTWLSIHPDDELLGYDTGPGNTLMDAWCHKHTGKTYDEQGKWAASGVLVQSLLDQLLQHPYLHLPAPKSTGREDFHLAWLEKQLEEHGEVLRAQDVQATLAHFTSRTLVQQIKTLNKVDQVFVCGGGAKNTFLMNLLAKELGDIELATTAKIGLDPDAVEAVAFAWFAYAFKHNIPSKLSAVTGARKNAVLGGLYPSGE